MSRIQAAVSLGASLAAAELPDDAPIPGVFTVFPPTPVTGDDVKEPELAQLRARAPQTSELASSRRRRRHWHRWMGCLGSIGCGWSGNGAWPRPRCCAM